MKSNTETSACANDHAMPLAELFAQGKPPAAASDGSPRELRVASLPASLLDRVAALCSRTAWSADTLPVAAWVLCESRWSGAREVTLLDRAGLGEPWRASTYAAANPDQQVDAWLAELDAARRESSVSPAGSDRNAAWMGRSASDADIARALVASLLAIGIADSGAECFVAYPAGAIEASQADALLAAFVHTLDALVAGQHLRASGIETLDEAQRLTLGARWNAPTARPDLSATVHGTFSRQAAIRKDATALVWSGGRLSYLELDRSAESVAASLAEAGVKPGSTVCVALDRSGRAIVVLLAILKAGAAYLPVDSSYPAERLAFMLEDADAKFVVTDASRAARFGASVRVLTMDALFTAASAAPQPVRPVVDAQALAYVMYTSGSTGLPKGIEICHRSILRLVIDPNYVELSPRTVFLQAAPLGFDAATLEIWGPLLNGGVCVVYEEDLPTAAGLAQIVSAHGVNSAWLTAALFNAVVDDDPASLRGLEQLLAGGEALSVPHIRKALAALPNTTLINGYGPTECTTFTATYRIPRDVPADARSIPIGRPINDTQAYVLSPSLHMLPVGMVGELYVGGSGLARGYLRREDLTRERFVPNPFGAPGERLYKTGDLVRYLADGNIEYIGRADSQIKVRGFRIEPGEIEAALSSHPAVKAATVIAAGTASGQTRLVAYLIAKGEHASANELRGYLAERLPEFMVPAAYVWMEAFPITANGKLDRRKLPAPTAQRPELAEAYREPANDLERKVCAVFAQVLDIDRVGTADNFFELGGNSLLVLRVLSMLEREDGTRLSTNAFFRRPTPAALARQLGGADDASIDAARLSRRHHAEPHDGEQEPIAIIAMAGRFPGARDVEQFWTNLCEGRDSITFFDDATLDPALSPELTADANYVKARGVIDDVEMFDAAFFGISPREAELTDPQQRIFLELCWECLERAGHSPDSGNGPVGVFAGMYNATYFQRHLLHRPDLIEKLGEFQVMLANEKDYITTRVAHRLNLTGPAVAVHTACSTSLVAVAQAFASLRAGQCDMALAGGASVTSPPRSGYLYEEGAMLSPDGHTRSFDAQAQGTVFSDGATVVLLKRLSDALADGNEIHAVIRGVAVNNDGRDKASFTAPSIDGQAAVVMAAHESAGIDPRTISYVETHGTATPMGDPIEVEGLTRAFRHRTSDIGFCRIGSVKSNIGHLVTAAGTAGLIKTALALSTQRLPASIHYTSPNPKIDFASSPFVVHDRIEAWPRGSAPRRAGVSSFGVGGTNAHVVVEEAPLLAPSTPSQSVQLLQLSAKTASALEAMARQLADHLAADPKINLADVAHTLRVGRSRFSYRLCVTADSVPGAVEALRTADHPARVSRPAPPATPALVWMFPGQGAQYAGMGQGLYESDAAFRAAMDEVFDALRDTLPFDLRERMFGDDAGALTATATTQPATFCLEYALARSWLARGLVPTALIGHSVGEFVAAVIAGVMPLADAARLVARRGALMQALPAGSMLSVRMTAAQLEPRLPAGLCLAAENGPTACVVAGPTPQIEAWRAVLESEGVVARLLQTSHAFHSSMMDPAVAPFEVEVRKVTLSAPKVPIVSTLTGEPMTDAQATDPLYWARHLRSPVRFSPAVRAAQAVYGPAFLEVGPRGTLATLARQHVVAGKGAPLAIASVGDSRESEAVQFALAQGHVWTLGVELAQPQRKLEELRRRLRLPTYPFERKRHWVDAPVRARSATVVAPVAASAAQIAPPPSAPASPSTSSIAIASPATPTPMSTATIPTASSAPRRTRLVAQLRQMFEDVAGGDFADTSASSTFVELGLDSLTLTQAALQLKRAFKVNVTFRQLMEQHRSFDALATFLDSTMPPEAATPAQPAAAGEVQPVVAQAVQAAQATPAPVSMPLTMAMPVGALPAAGGGNLVQQVIQQQMQLMAQQLALLSGAGVAQQPAAVPATAAVAPVAVVPAAGATPAEAAVAPAAAEEGGAVRYDVKKAFGAIARIHSQSHEVTDRQRARLAPFIRRYVERTRKSREHTALHRPHLADPRVVNGFRPATKEITYQIIVDRSKGSKMWDIDGNEYVDVLNGFGMSLFGWQPDFVVDAVRKQIDLGYDIGPMSPLAGEVAQLVCELTGMERAGLCNTGSEAVMAAMRIARTVTGRSTIVLFTGSYHGTFDEVVVRAGRNGKGLPAAPGIMPGGYSDVRVLDYGTPESLAFIREHAADLAAVLVEPVQSRRPDFQPKEFLREVREITQASGTCLIFDEVITGFRAHPGGTQALFGIRADLATYGKVIGGGFPIGVVAGKREFMDALDGGSWSYGDDSRPTVGVTYFAGTFVRHPLALAAAKASLEHLRKQGPELQAQLNLSTAAMADELNAYCREMGVPIEIRYYSSLWRVSWLEDHPLQDLLFAMMRNRGVHILDNFPCFLTTAHTPSDIATIKSAFKEALIELQEAEFLPKRRVEPAVIADANHPPVPNARLGRDKDGKPAWYVPDPNAQGKYIRIDQ